MANKKVIEGTDITVLQLGEFFAQVKSGAITRRVFQDFLGQAKKGVLATAIAATFVTASYFITRPGLWVDSDFTSCITAAYSDGLVPRGLDGVESFDLTETSYDHEILARQDMGGLENVRKHAFMPDQIAALIDLQPGGIEGRLLTNGYSNIFYVLGAGGEVFVVFVGWDAGDREWGVAAWGRGESGCWVAGLRVFRNTRALVLA